MTQRTKKYALHVFWTVAAAALGALCLSAAGFKSKTALKGIAVEIEGLDDDASFMNPADIEREITRTIGPFAGHTVGDVSCDAVEKVLSGNPFVENVQVYVSGNGELTAHISQRVPIVRVIANGRNFYIDENGKRMPASAYHAPHVHVATGLAAEIYAEDLVPLVQQLRRDEFMHAFIGQIYYPARDEVILVPVVGHARILFGKPERIAEKFENLKAFYSEVVTEVGWDQYRTVDLRFRDQIICKKNPTS